MNIHTLSSLLLAGLLVVGPAVSLAEDTTAPAASALPPGINPASPAGGNGGDADGLEQKPANPAPPGSQKKTPQKSTSDKANTHPGDKSTAHPKDRYEQPTGKKQNTTQ